MAKSQKPDATTVPDAPADFVDPAKATAQSPAGSADKTPPAHPPPAPSPATPPADLPIQSAADVAALKDRIKQLEAQLGNGGRPAFVAPNQPVGCTFWKVTLQEFAFHGEKEICVQAADAANALSAFYALTGIISTEFVPQVLPSSENEFADQQKRLEAFVPVKRLQSPMDGGAPGTTE